MLLLFVAPLIAKGPWTVGPGSAEMAAHLVSGGPLVSYRQTGHSFATHFKKNILYSFILLKSFSQTFNISIDVTVYTSLIDPVTFHLESLLVLGLSYFFCLAVDILNF